MLDQFDDECLGHEVFIYATRIIAPRHISRLARPCCRIWLVGWHNSMTFLQIGLDRLKDGRVTIHLKLFFTSPFLHNSLRESLLHCNKHYNGIVIPNEITI
jgi:hypothetical protein